LNLSANILDGLDGKQTDASIASMAKALAEHTRNLHEHLVDGGSLPTLWENKRASLDVEQALKAYQVAKETFYASIVADKAPLMRLCEQRWAELCALFPNEGLAVAAYTAWESASTYNMSP
jgi:hypothetical protein